LDQLDAVLALQDKDQVENLLAQLEAREAALMQADQEVEHLTDEDDLDVEIEESADYAERIVAAKVRLNRFIRQSVTPAPASAVSGIPSGFTARPPISAKLPKLQIHRYDGEVLDWTRFWSQFSSSVGSQANLSTVDKFNYLRSLLGPGPARVIEGLPLSSSNYNVAVDLLTAKYGRPEVLKSEHMGRLVQLKPAVWSEDGRDLRRLLEECRLHLRALDALGCDTSVLGSVIGPLIIRALPSRVIFEWNRVSLGKKDEQVTELLQFVQTEIESTERLCLARSQLGSSGPSEVSSVESTSTSRGGRSRRGRATVGSFVTKSEGTSSKPQPKCLFCGSNEHGTIRCSQVVSVRDRIQVLRKQNRCLKCFSAAHWARDCKAQIKCWTCQGAHHAALCQGQPTEESTSTAPVVVTSCIDGKSEGQQVALQSLSLWVINGQRRQRALVLLAGASERTFIKASFAQKLQLPCVQQEDLTVRSFGGAVEQRKSRLLKMTLEGDIGYCMQLIASEVPQVCSGVTLWEQSRIDSLLSGQEKNLLKNGILPAGKQGSVDLLIGADVYWTIVTGHMKRLGRAAMALQTVFGWTLQGKIGEVGSQSTKSAATLCVSTCNEASLNNQIRQFWDLDSSGALELEAQSQQTAGEQKVRQQFEKSNLFPNQQDAVCIPGNGHLDQFGSHLGISQDCSCEQITQLQKNEALCQLQGMQDYLDKKYSEVIVQPDPHGGSFLPHQVVVKEDTQKDEFLYPARTTQQRPPEGQLSKRRILEFLAQVFDPLGFVGPTLVPLKILLQKLWSLKLSWDEKIPYEDACFFQEWKEDFQALTQVRVQRWIGCDQVHNGELHAFCDSSQKAYGAAVYWRSKEVSMSSATLVASKNRIGPVKPLGIPRLELMACVIGVRLAQNILKAWDAMNLTVFYWTDSQVALQWINGPPLKWKVFVAHRVQEIQLHSKPSQWRYCPSKENPADLLTRGKRMQELQENVCWWGGPSWLGEDQQKWPVQPKMSQNQDKEMTVEERGTHGKVSEAIVCSTLVKPDNFSSWQRLVRLTGWVFRFLRNCRQQRKEGDFSLAVWELCQVEVYWCRQAQLETFPEEIQSLKKQESVANESKLKPFLPFLNEEGLLCIGVRLRSADLTEEEKHPILLAAHQLTTLFILGEHIKALHGGVRVTLARIRQRVWVLKGRRTVQNALRQCYVCRRWQAQAGRVIEGPVPSPRLDISPPFAVSGVDFAEPLWTQEKSSVPEKNYVCLFTCAVIRAVHLELVPSQTTEDFIAALRRFIARRGPVRILYSDNAQAFRQTDRLLQQAQRLVHGTAVQDFAASQKIEWRFIPARAAWWGGFYERMVGSVKLHLKRTLGRASLRFEELRTLLVEVEAVVNSRPLTYQYDNPEEGSELTPAHFLLGRPQGGLLDVQLVPSEPKHQELVRRWTYRKKLLDGFWSRWKHEYLLQLGSYHQVAQPRPHKVQTQDVVLVGERKAARGHWKKAIVEEVIPGRDQEVRMIVLRDSQQRRFRRAVQQVYPLEVVKE
jgi:hypothetical protein